jgi:hypothetical protein
MPILRIFSRFLLLGAIAGTLGACSSSPVAPVTPPAPVEPTPDPVQPPARGIYPTVDIQSEGEGQVRVALELKRVDVDTKVAGYQGALSFPAELSLERVEVPQGVVGSWNGGQSGRVEFAGAALDGMPGETMVVHHFHSQQLPKAGDLSLRMDELTSAGDLQNLMSLVSSKADRSLAMGAGF